MEDAERVTEHDERDKQRQEFPEIKLFLFIFTSLFLVFLKLKSRLTRYGIC